MINFTKMHGLGNDYIYIERLDDKNVITDDKIPQFTRHICNRHFGVGSDGVIFIENSEIADFKMSIYNQDGSIAEMCGNGIRCFAKYVYDNGLTIKKVVDIETLAGVKRAFLDIENGKVKKVRVCMGAPVIEIDELLKKNFIKSDIKNLEIVVEDKKFEFMPISMGNPHAVIIVSNLDEFDVHKYGSFIETNHVFPSKTNVEFIQIIDKENIKMRVWERGAGETFACGTGACAAAVACNIRGYTKKDVTVYLKGGELKISWNENDNNVYMTGTATKVYNGNITQKNVCKAIDKNI